MYRAGRGRDDAIVPEGGSAARRAVGDTGKTQAIIQTVLRRGFRFVADVDGATSTGNAPDADPDAAPVDVALTAPPDRPSIAVLPFASLSDDAEQQYFADGMAEDIIAGLSKFGSLLVIARNSTFSYQGQAIDIRTVARELGVRYVLEGSIRRSGPRIRVSVQLIDAETGSHIWAEHYDRSLDDIFAVQDEVTAAIVGAIAPETAQAEVDRAKRIPPESLDSWGLIQKGLAIYASGEMADLEAAIEFFAAAREADPNFAEATAMTAHGLLRTAYHFPSDNKAEMVAEGIALIQTALRQDPGNLTCLLAQGWMHIYFDEPELAVLSCREAVARNPNWAQAHQELGFFLSLARHHEECLELIEIADRLSPRDPRLSGRQTIRAGCYFAQGQFAESAEWARRASRSQNPRYWVDAMHVAALYRLGDTAGIEAAKRTLMERKPNCSLSDLDKLSAEILDALREVALPE